MKKQMEALMSDEEPEADGTAFAAHLDNFLSAYSMNCPYGRQFSVNEVKRRGCGCTTYSHGQADHRARRPV